LVLGAVPSRGATFVGYLLERGCKVLAVSRSPERDSILLAYRYRREVSPGQFEFVCLDLNRDFVRLTELIDKFEPEYVRELCRAGRGAHELAMARAMVSDELPRRRAPLRIFAQPSLPQTLPGCVHARSLRGQRVNNLREKQQLQPEHALWGVKTCRRLAPVCSVQALEFPRRFYPRRPIYTGASATLSDNPPVRRLPQARAQDWSARAGDWPVAHSFTGGTWLTRRYRALINGRNGEVYHLSPNEGPMSIAEVVRVVAELMDKPFEDCVEFVDENFGQDAVFSLDSSKARVELGWSPQVGFIDGVRETITWIEDNWDFIRAQPLDYIHQP